MKINEFDNEVTQKQLDILEMYIDKVFNKIGIDVEFTRHFLDRVNDERNVKQITIKELGALFAKEYKRWGKPIAQMGPDKEAVMKDLESDINIPFALNWDRNKNQLELVAKTVMRKKNFRTPNKEFPVESIEEHDDPSSYVKTIRKAGYSIYVSKIAGGEGGTRFEVETPSGKEFEVIERETGHYELFANGPTMSGKGEVFGSLMDAIRAAETENVNEARPNKVAEFDGPGYKTVKIYKLPGGRYYGDTGDFDFERDSLQSLKATLNKWGYRKLIWGSLGEATPSPLEEDIGSIPPLADLIVMAVVGQTTVAALKAAWKTGKYALKLKRLADKAGVKLNQAVYGEAIANEAKLSSEQRDRLDDLIYDLRYLTMPHNDWDDFDNVEAARNVIDNIRSEFGNKVADQIEKGSEEIWHGYRPNSKANIGRDNLSNRKSTRITKSGKANKTDIASLKREIQIDRNHKNRRNRSYSSVEATVNEKADNVKEAINRDEYASKLAAQQKDKFFAAALAALDRLVKSDPRGQSVDGYAFDIARAFNGINGKELVRAYNEVQ